jgi:hypothetical protein
MVRSPMTFADDPESRYSLTGVVDSYSEWLIVKSPQHAQAFKQRLRQDPEGAHAEAVTFAVLHAKRKNPRPAEIIGTGGVDFHCQPDQGSEFVVEVTALATKAVSEKSGLTGPGGNRVGAFSKITTSLMREAVNKASQMANYAMPRVLVLASSHPDASMLLGAYDAMTLLTGTTVIGVPLEGAAPISTLAHLNNSVFMRINKAGNAIEPARQSISAILLMTISSAGAGVIGILHPEPRYVFDYRVFETIHFVKVRDWPISGGFSVEWVGPEPKPTFIPHWPIALRDKELRNLD